jgi:hypothetical protein
VSSNERSESAAIDIARDVRTTKEDVDALNRASKETPSWLRLSWDALEALLPPDALNRRPPTPATAKPFELP